MRLSGSIERTVFGFMLAIGVTFTLPYVALGASQFAGGSGRFGAPRMRPAHPFSRPFHGHGFLGVGGFDGQDVIIIQQVQPPAIPEPKKSANNQIYVPPQWIDGGHGVQLLRPGYWTSPKQAAER